MIAAAAIIGYMLWFAWPGIRAPFSADDLMNLHAHVQAGGGRLAAATMAYWRPEFRPLGGLFYVTIYHLFGFDPLPFRIGCFLLLAANLGLFYETAHRLSGSREVGVLAALIASYHAWFVDLYYTTGTVYELLCYFCYFAALVVYLRARQAGRGLRRPEWVALLLLYVGALASKEMAVTLPLALAVYELLFSSGRRNLAPAAVTALMTVPYVLGKLSGTSQLALNASYHPDLSASRFLHAFQLYTNVLFYHSGQIRSATVVLLLVVMLELALLARSRTLGFAWCFVLFSVLPFIFIPHDSGFFLYIPMAGWALYGARALVLARDALLRRRTALIQAATFAAVALALAPIHARMTPQALRVFESIQPPVRKVSAQLAHLVPQLPKGAHVVFLNDTRKDYQPYWLLFLLQLQYHDLGIHVTRTPATSVPPGKWDIVLSWHGAELERAAGT